MSELNNIALKILEKGNGILAADESTATMMQRLNMRKCSINSREQITFMKRIFQFTLYERLYWWCNSCMMKQLNNKHQKKNSRTNFKYGFISRY